MDAQEIRSILYGMNFMRGFSNDLKEKVAAILTEVSELRRVPVGDTWIREGEKSESKGYILLKGSVAIRKSEAQQHSEEAPELLGEIMQFNPAHSRSATVVASEDCVILRFVWDDFWEKIRQVLTEGEQEKVMAGVETFAWEHFTR